MTYVLGVGGRDSEGSGEGIVLTGEGRQIQNWGQG